MYRPAILFTLTPFAAVTRGKVKQGGKITAMLKLLPVVKPIFQYFPVILKNWVMIMRHRRTKGAATDRSNLKPHIPSLYSTQGQGPEGRNRPC